MGWRRSGRRNGMLATSIILAMGLVLTGQVESQEATVSDADALDALVAEAVIDYPAILAQWAEVDGLETRERQVNQPFDPGVTLGIANLPIESFRFDQHGMTGVPIGISERFYWPGVLDARGDAARVMAETRAAYIPETVVRIWLAAVAPYSLIAELDRALMVLDERREILIQLRNAARARYEARAVPLTDVLRVQTEISRVDQDVAAVVRGRRIAVADLNGLLNRDSTLPIAVSVTSDDDPVSPEGGPADWLAMAIESRPAFAALDAEERLVAVQRVAAEADDDPIWALGLGYTLRFQDGVSGSDLLTLTTGITLPFFSANRTDARLDELDARNLEIDFGRQELIRQLRADIGTQIEAMESLTDEIGVLDDELIPSVENMYDSALAHYASSHVPVETLIEIQDRLLELDLARTRLVSTHDMHRARLRALAVDSEAIRPILWSEQ